MKSPDSAKITEEAPNFIKERIEQELKEGKYPHGLVTRFPPEPNGFLHIGHAKSICLNFGLTQLSDPPGVCNLRFDDTNPEAEEQSYVDAIKRDVHWLGFDWGEREYYASDYFEQLYVWACKLIEAGKAYVDSQRLEEIRATRGDFHHPGQNSPFRERTVAENLDLFKRMRMGEFAEGTHVLRAKIDMASPDVKLRDPLMYRIRKASHHRTKQAWPIYPMYDWAHGQSDAIEGITHSLCTLEFQNHRGLYDWFLEALQLTPKPQQIEFARLNLTYTVLSKRKLQTLVEEKYVHGWDDPRMPTLAGLRRRGYTPEAIRNFCERIGISKRDGFVDVSLLEHELRENLNARCPRVMAVLNPLKVVIENFPEGKVEMVEVPNHPEHPGFGTRKVPFTRTLYIERDDFSENPPKKWFRLAPNQEVRLRSACLLTCKEVIKDVNGEIVELRCVWDPQSTGGSSPDGRKVRGTLHWVAAEHAIDAEVHLYDRLFTRENPLSDEHFDFTHWINSNSLQIVQGCKLEASLQNAAPGSLYQFERIGYFCVDPEKNSSGEMIFNRTIGLRDSWAKFTQQKEPTP